MSVIASSDAAPYPALSAVISVVPVASVTKVQGDPSRVFVVFRWKENKGSRRWSYFQRVCFPIILYYVPRRIMRVITRRGTMLAGDRSQGAISPASILSESRNYPNFVHWRIFYFMWLRRIYEFFCVHSNPIWKGRNCRVYRQFHSTFREYFRPFWFSRSCVVVSSSVL